MRLTLRTMLAYTDGILEPEDAEDIGRKIEDSEYATGLLHRARDVMRRLRLAAPSLTDRGPQFDPNTVAEYLDNTLHDDRVPDFEKVCLDSDVHLAEVASCHQILTLVLGEPAEIEPASRQRMYELAQRDTLQAEANQQSPTVDVVSGDGKSIPQAPPLKHRRRPVVPDYLRDPPKKRRVVPVAAAMVAVVCCVVAVLAAIGQFRPGTPLGSVLTQLGLGAQQVAKQDGGDTLGPDSDTPGPDRSQQGPVAAPQPAEHDTAVPEAPFPQELTDGQDPTVNAETEAPPTEPAAPAEPQQPPKAPIDPQAEDDPLQEIAPLPPGNPPLSLDDPPLPPDDPTEPAAETEPPPSEDTDAPQAPVPPQRMGRFMSDREVLLRFDSDAAAWYRVPAKGILHPGQRLITLPTYRPEIALTAGAGINLQLLGGTEIELLPGGEQELAGLRIRRGRVFIMPLIEAGAQLRLVVGNRSGVITFADAESVVAVEAVPMRLDGTNPEANPGLVRTYLFATKTGHVLWDEGVAGAVVRVDAGHCLALEGVAENAASSVVSATPGWGRDEAFGSWDTLASPVLEESLDTQRPASLGLMELAEHRQREVRWLAVRCLGRIGQFGPLVAALKDPEHRQLWPECVDELRQAVWRNAEAAAVVRQTMQKELLRDADQVDALVRILWGYTEQDLRDGGAETLIDYLMHEHLALRVLSFSTLKDLTALRLNYAPDDPEVKRRQRAAVWRQRLESGEIWAKLAEEGERKAAGNPLPQIAPAGEAP